MYLKKEEADRMLCMYLCVWNGCLYVSLKRRCVCACSGHMCVYMCACVYNLYVYTFTHTLGQPVTLKCFVTLQCWRCKRNNGNMSAGVLSLVDKHFLMQYANHELHAVCKTD